MTFRGVNATCQFQGIDVIATNKISEILMIGFPEMIQACSSTPPHKACLFELISINQIGEIEKKETKNGRKGKPKSGKLNSWLTVGNWT